MLRWLIFLSLMILYMIPVAALPQEHTKNRVLSLDSDRDYVEMADSELLNDIGSQVTMEAWIKPTGFPNQWIALVRKEDELTPNISNRSYVLQLNSSGFIELTSAPEGQGGIILKSPNGLIILNNWHHVAGVVDSENGRMKIFINGVEVASRNFGKDIHVSKLPLRIGWTHEENVLHHGYFAGQMDEVRIWNTARSQEEIRQTMYKTLSGKEPGLVGYWNFGGGKDAVTDLSPNGIHGKLIGDAHLVGAELVIPTTISGIITDESGKPVSGADVRLEKDGEAIAQAQSDASGSYLMFIWNPAGLYDVSAGKGELGSWRLDFPLGAGEQKTLDLTPRKSISIEGTLLMLDDKTPHVAVVVQAIAIRKGEPVIAATSLSDENGKYQFINLRPGKYRVRCQAIDGHIYYRNTDDALTVTTYQDEVPDVGDILTVRPGKPYEGIDFHFAPFRKGTWRNYGYLDGLLDESVNAICSAPDGTLWFGTNGGVSCYDGEKFTNFTKEKDGLVNNTVLACYADADGTLWFGTGNGVSRYDSEKFTNFTAKDGLASNEDGVSYVSSICRDSDGAIWFGTGSFGTSGGGVSRYDGRGMGDSPHFVTFTTKDGLAGNTVASISLAPNGTLWFGSWGGGVWRYDGEEFAKLSGLPNNNVLAVHCAPDGITWIGSLRGVSRYDGKELVNFTTSDGLADNYVLTIHRGSDGAMWFGTGDGVSRYDGVGFVNFTTSDGLAGKSVNAIHKTPDGAVWFGTGKGISRYDSSTLYGLTTRDGLINDSVNDMYRAPDGVFWFATAGGVSNYDGRKFGALPVKADVNTICRDSDGAMWFTSWFDGTYRYDEAGLVKPAPLLQPGEGNLGVYPASDGSLWIRVWGWGAGRWGTGRYGGGELEHFNKAQGLAGNIVSHIQQDADGNIWFGTRDGGVSQYDGKKLINFTVKDGLVDNSINTVYCAPDGIVWFGTAGGVSRYDGVELVNFTIEDGLVYNDVRAIHCASDGAMWFGTNGGGACRYDGTTWTSLDARDGLSNYITSIQADEDGNLWFGTADRGVISYRPDSTPPKVRITSVEAEKQLYTDLASIPAVTVGDHVTIEYSAIDLKTTPGKRQYRRRIKELDADWRSPTREAEFLWTPDKPGSYTFEVQAIDRDLNYSEPVKIELTVVPPFYLRAVFLIPTIGSGITLLATLIILATALTKRRRQVHAYQKAAVLELQDAREMQMSLLPETAPMIAGVEIQGKSMTANTVGGDFFGYLKLPDGRTGIVVADVSGKGLKAAMSATMTNGMLHEVVKIKASSGRILSELNAELCPLMQKHMFAALSFAIINEGADTIQWSNAAQPLPLIKRGNEASEAEGEGELPLGMMADVAYTDYELRLGPGDTVVFYTDGIIETENEAEEMYGTERLVKCMADMDPTLRSEGIMEAIFQDVSNFMGSAQQYDDITVVVLKKL